MVRFLPLCVLITFFSLFGIAWIVVSVNPDVASWYIFGTFILLIFISSFCAFGTVLYFLRTRLYKRYSPNWYFNTSFKMAFFIALFLAMAATLAMFQLVTTFNLILVILAIVLFAVWSYLGRKK